MRLLAIDDDPEVLEILQTGLAPFSKTTDVAATAAEGMRLLSEVEYDILLLDVDLPDLSGFDVARRLRQEGYTLPIMMITALNAEDDIVAGLEAGADGYVTKPFSLKELSARLDALHRRREIGEALPLTFADVRVDEAKREAIRGQTQLRLTETEFRLLAFFLRNPGKDITRDDLLEEIWGMSFNPGTGVVDVHLGNLRKKLRTVGPPIIQTVRGVGFRLENPS
jgi:DNA-binding response OmpR family regulator